jgi:hypothetical protein
MPLRYGADAGYADAEYDCAIQCFDTEAASHVIASDDSPYKTLAQGFGALTRAIKAEIADLRMQIDEIQTRLEELE